MKKEAGISLLELLISLFVASLLMTLILQQYLMIKRQYLKMHKLLEQSIEVQMVTELIRDSVRMGGFTPCAAIGSLHAIDRRTARTGLSAIEFKQESLKINRMDEHFATLIRQISPAQLLLQTDSDYEEGEAILIADCFHAEVQQVMAVRKTKAGTILTLRKSLAFDYRMPVYLGEWVEEQFFIQKNQQGKPSLFYKQKHAEELGNFVHALAVKLITGRGKIVVEVSLGLENHGSWVVKTGIRTL